MEKYLDEEMKFVKKMQAPQDMQNGAKFKTNKHGYVTIIEYYNCHTVIVAFENTGNIRAISATKLRSGNVPDRTVPPESIMLGEKVHSLKHGWLTITQVESENIIILTDKNNQTFSMLLPAVQKMKNKSEQDKTQKATPIIATSLQALTKKNKKTRDVNSMLKKILTDYGN